MYRNRLSKREKEGYNAGFDSRSGPLSSLFSCKRGKIVGITVATPARRDSGAWYRADYAIKSVGLGLERDQRLACAPLGRVGSNPTPGATNNSPNYSRLDG